MQVELNVPTILSESLIIKFEKLKPKLQNKERIELK